MDISENCYSDLTVDQLLCEYDEKLMPLPDIEYEPHLLISKVRKHYMEHIIKLLSINYETNQRLLNKNIYLPSAIWRCAKYIEMSAAQMSMVVHLYRKNIVTVIKELKNDTEKGKLYRKLYECLHIPAGNEKKLQATLDSNCNCECSCNQRKRRRKISVSPKTLQKPKINSVTKSLNCNNQNKIPVIINSQVEVTSNVAPNIPTDTINVIPNKNITNITNTMILKTSELQDEQDELMLQLEKIFQSEPNDDDLFESTLCDVLSTNISTDNSKTNDFETETLTQQNIPLAVTEKNLSNERCLASCGGLLVRNNNDSNNTQKKCDRPKKRNSKWLCEEYFLKVKLYELLDQIRDSNRKKYERIKLVMLELFGDDSDDEGLMSPLNETSEFIVSCKERIAPWIVKLLTPYYVKGRIRGKILFKALAKHLIRLIYQCSPYPYEYEVKSFVSDFMNSHHIIRCEADFKQFKINNI